VKYKTLFRVLLKFAGVWLSVEGLVNIVTYASSFLVALSVQQRGTFSTFSNYWYVLGPAVQFALGVYLFFGGKWIADLALPGNRPYCHECGYDLTAATGDRCNECGTPFRKEETAHA